MIAEHRPLHILVVDDDDNFCELVGEIIEGRPTEADGIHITRLRDGREAVNFFAKLASDDQASGSDSDAATWPDVALIDQRMTTMDGSETIRRLRESDVARNAILCIMSSSDQPAEIRRAYQAGASFYLVKPYEFERLESKLWSLIDFFRTIETPSEPAGDRG